MRFFTLLNLQDVILAIFPTLMFILVFGLGLAYAHWHTGDSEKRMDRVTHRYPDGIEDRDAPFPLVLVLIIAGTVIWAFFYILFSV
ncbi:MAG: hypothetical protein QGG48_12905 [Desulfatiglandales bacterium]|nr:hypothetical protein [Desulfatiglandales bacterium]